MSTVLHILQHSLGCDEFGRGTMYRNHFVTGEGSDDYPICMEAVALGLMNRRDGFEMTGGMDLFTVTVEGKQWMAENSPAPPKLTRSQRRYQAFLNADTGLSFIEFARQYRVPTTRSAAA